MNNKWIRAVIPALLIHISVGTVYCWSTFKETIAAQIEMSPFAVRWAFSFAIFFLGMSAAWAVAGLTGNNTSEILLNTTGSYQVVIAVATALYTVALLICILLVQNKKKEIIE